MIQSPMTANVDIPRGLLSIQKNYPTAGLLGRSVLPAQHQDVFLRSAFRQSLGPVRSLTFGMLPREVDELGPGGEGSKAGLEKSQAHPSHFATTSENSAGLVLQNQTASDSWGPTLLELFSPKFSRMEVAQNAGNLFSTLLKQAKLPVHQLLMLRNENGRTLLDLIFSHKSVEGMTALLDYGLDIEHRDSATGETLLHKASEFGGSDLVERLLQRGANPNAQSFKGKTPLHLAAAQGNSSTLKRLLINGALPSIRDYSGLLPSDSGALALYSSVVLDELKSHGAPNSVFTDVLELWHRDHIAQNPKSPGVLGLVKIMPQLMAVPGKELMPLFYEVDQFFANFEEHRGYHPNESEWMLFLKHPDFLDRKSDTISFLALALTSITHFIEDRIPLSDKLLKTWGDIGFLSHSFKFWRYDTLGGSESLFSQFGFNALSKPLHKPEDLESSAASARLYQKLGAGFKMKDLSTDITYMFRRSFMMACHPEFGTLVIRNSSPEFGRDTMKHPAYYLPVEVPDLQMETFDPGNIPEKWHILNKSLYASDVLGEEGNTQDKIAALSDALMGIKDRYRRFKLDTESFEGYGDDRHFSGHLSPGFVPLVKHLLKLCPLLEKQGKPLPDLAFAHPEFPLFQPYGRFPLTPSHLKELRDFASGAWSSALYPNSQWLAFLVNMGVNNHAELVLIPPEEG